jgi:two-component system, OmpR family, sensor kinase
MGRILPAGLFDRLRAQVLLLLAVGLLVVDLCVLVGVHVIQDGVVDRTLTQASDRIGRIPTDLPPATTYLVDALAPSELYIAYVGADDEVLTSSDPTSTDDVPQLDGLLTDDDLGEERVTRTAPGGTTYELVRVEVPVPIDIVVGDETVGVASVVIGYPMADMERTVRRLVLVELLSGLAVLGAALVFSRRFVRAGLRPLHRIGRTAEAIAAGRTGERVTVDEDDVELREVATAINDAFDARQASEDRMRDFVADASHELRTPLASVRGWADLYLQGGVPPDGVDEAMTTIHAEAGRMEELVEDMLMLARYDATPGAAPTEPVHLAPMLADLVDTVGRLHEEHSYAAIGAVDVTVRADAGSLRRALANLMVNAGRHTPAGTRIAVSVVTAGDHVEVRVADDGPGLTAAERDAAFDRFWRGEKSRGRTGAGGTGLGLAISRSILRAVGGDLRLDETPGGGLTAVVSLVQAR